MIRPLSQRSRIVLFYLIFAMLFVNGVLLMSGSLPVFFVAIFSISREVPSAGEKEDNEFILSDTVRIVSTVDDWKDITSTGCCVLYVTGSWNPIVVGFHKPYSEFTQWCSENTDYQTILVTINPHTKDALWSAIQELWEFNSIYAGSMKNYGGAGRVVWFQDGRVVDYAWCYEVYDLPRLKSRTEVVFK